MQIYNSFKSKDRLFCTLLNDNRNIFYEIIKHTYYAHKNPTARNIYNNQRFTRIVQIVVSTSNTSIIIRYYNKYYNKYKEMI